MSIVIVNWNTTDLLRACLESIGRHPPSFDFEIVVVDNASNEFDERAMNDAFPNVVFIRNADNLGYAEGNNQGIAQTSGNYALLLNPDTEVKPGSLTSLVEFMERHDDAAAAGCRLVRPDGSLDRSLRSFPEPMGIAAEFLGLSRVFPKSRVFGAYRLTWFDYDTVIEVDQPMGSCLILSRRALAELGGFDEDFPIFFNEVDWCYRAKQAGWRIYFTPDAEIVHHGGAGTRQVRREMRRESHRSLIRFYHKNYRSKIPFPVHQLIIGAIRISQFFGGLY